MLEYVINYHNVGNGALNTIVISDATPAYTILMSATCDALPFDISACSVTTQPAAGTGGSITWTLTGTLASAVGGAVILRVTAE